MSAIFIAFYPKVDPVVETIKPSVKLIQENNIELIVGIVGVVLVCVIVYTIYSNVSETSVVKLMSFADKKLSQLIDNNLGVVNSTPFTDKNSGIDMVLDKKGTNFWLKIFDSSTGTYKDLLQYKVDVEKITSLDVLPVVDIVQSESYNAAWSFLN